ncbi:MAG: hypothetical protein KDK39_07405 [Leptospiraceae bacterium]|nr:hypothetical protein [Leptospiraceae bacterium]
MKNKFWTVSVMFFALALLACGEKSDEQAIGEEHIGHESMDGHSMQSQYQSADAGNLKASFEFSTMAQHMQAMKKMNMEMPMNMDHDQMGDHHVMLTLLNQSDNKMNMDVKAVTFTITGPDGKSMTRKGHVMHAETMHHFGTGFQASGPGTYKIKASFAYAGKDYNPTVEFVM